ncbi:MAG: hypothetical protein FRX49_11845 [Trebouxia sp. A1-2]|nr:MAG: hypothetical protein FRX49_11845 [Trebouxia sp. A1-2]
MSRSDNVVSKRVHHSVPAVELLKQEGRAWFNELSLMSVRRPEAWTRGCTTLPALLKDIVKVLILI